MIRQIKVYEDRAPIVIYGFGVVGKVLIKELIDRGIKPVYILDKYKSCCAFQHISVFSLEETRKLDKEVNIIVTPLLNTEEIFIDLKKSGYIGEIIQIKELLKNKNL